ncbi:hypothetical protein Tco_1282172 [Tanacetum coccineum]
MMMTLSSSLVLAICPTSCTSYFSSLSSSSIGLLRLIPISTDSDVLKEVDFDVLNEVEFDALNEIESTFVVDTKFVAVGTFCG